MARHKESGELALAAAGLSESVASMRQKSRSDLETRVLNSIDHIAHLMPAIDYRLEQSLNSNSEQYAEANIFLDVRNYLLELSNIGVHAINAIEFHLYQGSHTKMLSNGKMLCKRGALLSDLRRDLPELHELVDTYLQNYGCSQLNVLRNITTHEANSQGTVAITEATQLKSKGPAQYEEKSPVKPIKTELLNLQNLLGQEHYGFEKPFGYGKNQDLVTEDDYLTLKRETGGASIKGYFGIKPKSFCASVKIGDKEVPAYELFNQTAIDYLKTVRQMLEVAYQN